MTAVPLVVLYAEDSDDDAFLMRRAFNKANFPGTLVIMPNGLEAKNYLSGEGAFSDRAKYPVPQLVLLDIKMPFLNGLQVLQDVRGREEYQDTPVLMFTSSSQDRDVSAAYAAGADSYLVKPANLEHFRELVQDLLVLCAKRGRPKPPLNLRGAVPPP